VTGPLHFFRENKIMDQPKKNVNKYNKDNIVNDPPFLVSCYTNSCLIFKHSMNDQNMNDLVSQLSLITC